MCVSIGWVKMISTSRIRSIYTNGMSMSLMPHHSISFLWMQRTLKEEVEISIELELELDQDDEDNEDD